MAGTDKRTSLQKGIILDCHKLFIVLDLVAC